MIKGPDKEKLNDLIAGIAAGKEDALVELYESVGGRMLSFARSILRDSALAEDAVQESLIKIVKYAKSFRYGTNGYAWILSVVRNESITVAKNFGQKYIDIDDCYYISDPVSVDHAERHDLNQALKKLTLNDRKLIWLRYVADMTVREIAAELKAPRSTVQYDLKKAENSLRKILEEKG